MIRWFLPRDDSFYASLERQAGFLVEAARALARLADGDPPQATHEVVRDIERRADELVFELDEQLAAVFVTPIGREGIQLLASTIDEIIDTINLTARLFVLFDVPQPTRPMAELMHLLVVMTELLDAELPALRRHQYDRLFALDHTLRRHEKEGDRIFRSAVGELANDRAIDPKRLLREKEVLQTLESAIDTFEVVGEQLKNLAVKQG